MADKNVPYEAEWAKNLQHRPDPNRVTELQMPDLGGFQGRTAAAQGIPADPATRERRVTRVNPQATREDREEPSYYDVPLLQKPVWKWEIANYFYLGGLSAGAYVIARMADRHGGDEMCKLSQVGSYLALAAFVPCPLLLIHDLGDPKRFHHMMRVWKPSSPMNLGTWSIVGYSGMAGFEVVRQVLQAREGRHIGEGGEHPLLKVMNNRVVGLLHDIAGVPFAVMVAGYTGVLLSCTANPLWSKNSWIGPLFSASAISSGAGAISLALDLTCPECDSPAQHVLEHIDSAAHAAEAACFAGYLRSAGEKAKTFRRGSQRKHLIFTAAALAGAEVLKHLPLKGRAKKGARIAASILGLASAYSMRWAFIYGGKEAAEDPHTSRLAGRPEMQEQPGRGKAETGALEDVTRRPSERAVRLGTVAHG